VGNTRWVVGIGIPRRGPLGLEVEQVSLKYRGNGRPVHKIEFSTRLCRSKDLVQGAGRK